jgi:hypothetical protein
LPNWTTTAGSIASVYEYSSISSTVTATGDAPVSYALYSGSLPSGSSLNTSTGLISGTSIASAGATTSSFVIRATDGQLQDSDRSFSITVNTDVVTWVSPANNSTVTLPLNSASSTALSATSAAGKSITYTANALPTGLSIVSSAVTGTPTVTANTTSLFTATAATDGKTTTATINWVVSVASDPYFNSVVLLLSASTPTSNFIADASVNTFAIAPGGTPSANVNNPLQPGYYSGYFNGSTDYLTVPSNAALAFGTGEFTIECWVYFTNSVANHGVFQLSTSLWPAATSGLAVYVSGGLGWGAYYNGTGNNGTPAPIVNTWFHVALVRSGTTTKLYVNGAQILTATDTTNYTGTYLSIGGYYSTAFLMSGYISNFRIVKGTAVYTGAFTPPTLAPLTNAGSTSAASYPSTTNVDITFASSATSLLTLQSYRFIDNSSTPQTITPTGPPSISVTQPFTLPSPYTGYGSGLFNGTGDYLTTPANTTFVFGTGDFTMEAWVYATALPTAPQGTIMANGGNSNITTNYSVIVYLSTTLYPVLYVGTSSTPSVGITSSSAIVINTWNHISVTRSGITFTIWLNGVSVASGTSSVNLNTSQDLYISRTYSDLANRYLTGYISNARILKGTAVYTGAFTPPTLAPLTNAGATSAAAYPSTTNVDITFASSATSLLTLQNNQAQNNNQFRDSSTNNFAVTRTGTPTQGTFTPFSQTGWSGYFNGSSDYLTTPTSLNTAMGGGFAGNVVTIECWIYPISYSASNSYYTPLIGTYAGVAANGRWYFGYTGSATSAGYLKFMYTTSTGSQNDIQSTIAVNYLNSWNHIAVTIDATTAATTTIKFFSNGVLTDTFTSQNLSSQTAYYSSPSIANNMLLNGHAGYISNLRVVTGVAVYTGTFTPPITPLTVTQSAGTNIAAIAGTATSLLTLQDNRFKDNSTNNFAITPSGTPSIQAFSPFAPTALYSAATVGGSMYFNGSTDWLTLLTNANIPYAYKSGNFCLECWHYMPSAYSSTNYLVSYWNSAPDKVIILGYSPVTAGKLSFFWTTNGTTDKTITSADVIPINQWHHIAAMRTGNTISLFVDGIRVATASEAGTLNSTGLAGNNTIMAHNAGAGALTPGYLHSLRSVIGNNPYDATLTTLTVPTAPLTAISGTSLLLNATNSGIYDSTGKNDLTTVGDARTSTAVIKYGSSSMYFDGTGDYLNCGYSPQFDFGTGDFTVECWVYTTSYATAQGLFESRVQADVVEANRLMLSILVTSGYPQLYNASNDVAVISTIAIPLNTWTHVAFTRNSGTARVFVNGQVGATNVSFTTNFLVNKLIIGAMIQSSGGGVYNRNFFNGYIDDYRITKGIARYTTTFTPPTAPFALQ